MFMNVPKSGYNTYFIYSSSCVIYKITNPKELVNSFFISPSYIFIILYLLINILYLNLKFIDFMGIFLYIYAIYFHIIRFTTAFINFALVLLINYYHIILMTFIYRYGIKLHKIRTPFFNNFFTSITN